MPQPPNLLNDDGTASVATLLLMSHHAFRRDLTRFIQAVIQIKAGDTSRTEAVRWGVGKGLPPRSQPMSAK